MENSFFEKLSINYQNLSDRFVNHAKHYQDGYAIYDKEMFVVRDENLEFLNQFKEIPFRTFYSKSHLEKYDFGGPYYNSATVVEMDKTVNIHTELSLVIFYYMIYRLKDDVIKFIDVVESDAFKAKLDNFYKIDKHTIRYNLYVQDLFYKFMSANVPNFNKIYHLFHWTNSGLMVVDDSEMIIRIERIKSILNSLEDTYDFSHVEIK